MTEPDYSRSLNSPGEPVTDKIRIHFRQRGNKIELFIVQYYALINGRWRSIMRFDACHGYPHQHTYYLSGEQRILTLAGDLNTNFTEASKFITRNFKKIKENFMLNH